MLYTEQNSAQGPADNEANSVKRNRSRDSVSRILEEIVAVPLTFVRELAAETNLALPPVFLLSPVMC